MGGGRGAGLGEGSECFMGTECREKWTVLEMQVATAARCRCAVHFMIKMAIFMLCLLQ